MTALDDLVYRRRDAAGEPEGMLVLFHGRGADENDLFGLLDALDPDRRLAGFTPRGPQSYFPPGGAHWYRLQRVGYPDPDTFLQSYALLGGWLEAVTEDTGIGLDRTILGGFSQGAVMAYSMAFGPNRPAPTGLLAFSGFIPEVPGFDLALDGRPGYPVAIGHGVADQVIPVEFGRAARKRLEASGAEVVYSEAPMPHAIDPDFLVELRPWVAARVGRSDQ
jgi:phospholipase/carboxylesterase